MIVLVIFIVVLFVSYILLAFLYNNESELGKKNIFSSMNIVSPGSRLIPLRVLVKSDHSNSLCPQNRALRSEYYKVNTFPRWGNGNGKSSF